MYLLYIVYMNEDVEIRVTMYRTKIAKTVLRHCATSNCVLAFATYNMLIR